MNPIEKQMQRIIEETEKHDVTSDTYFKLVETLDKLVEVNVKINYYQQANDDLQKLKSIMFEDEDYE